MSISWVKVSIPLHGFDEDIVVAFLSELPFNSFENTDDVLNAYITQGDLLDCQSRLDLILQSINLKFSIEVLPDVDWNATWESNFKPTIFEDELAILAPFHVNNFDTKYSMIIAPKMAFGTGHHGTTFGMIRMMKDLPVSDLRILDFGAGTGILAIYAALKGAKEVIAIDIETPAFENMVENFQLNQIENITPILGDKEAIPADLPFDLILANITKNILVDAMPNLNTILTEKGQILFSGFFYHDLVDIQTAATMEGLKFVQAVTEGDWCIALFSK